MQSKKMFFVTLPSVLFIASVALGGEFDTLIKPSDLSKIMKQSDMLIIEATEPAIYEKSHIPNARLLPISKIKNSIDKDYQKQNGFPVRPEKMEEILRSLGVRNDSRVVIYDSGEELDKGSGLVWTLLKVYGLERIQILSGGKKRWAEEGYPLTAAMTEIMPSSIKIMPRKDLVVSADWILKNLKSGIKLLDARLPDEFLGESSMGHLPGALHLEWHEMQDPKETFKSTEEISSILSKRGIKKDDRIITYCNWGPKASFLFAVLKSMGYNVQIYWGGIDEWSSDEKFPIIDESSKK